MDDKSKHRVLSCLLHKPLPFSELCSRVYIAEEQEFKDALGTLIADDTLHMIETDIPAYMITMKGRRFLTDACRENLAREEIRILGQPFPERIEYYER